MGVQCFLLLRSKALPDSVPRLFDFFSPERPVCLPARLSLRVLSSDVRPDVRQLVLSVLFSVLAVVSILPGCSSTPDSSSATIEGQMYVRLASGRSVPLGGISVFAVPDTALTPHFRKRHSISMSKVDTVARRASRYLQSAAQSSRSKSRVPMAKAERLLKKGALSRLPSFYLRGVPALDTAITDPEGRFLLQVPPGDTAHVVATATRSVPTSSGRYERPSFSEGTERLHWVHPVSPPAGDTTQVTLYNNNEGPLAGRDSIFDVDDLRTRIFFITGPARSYGSPSDPLGNDWITHVRAGLADPAFFDRLRDSSGPEAQHRQSVE